ncbi:Metallothionein, Plant group-2 [Zostera marina]|uniref:Metallothionein-like protein n=1 Tax=Zostera marina TaxID=29655 RepID=A0A0K9PF38_ZOSMR|nr:Metallothionein, Plant group-2 [Zostera marina]
MSCSVVGCGCGPNCKCGSDCRCGSGSKNESSQINPVFMESHTSSETILGVAPHQSVKTDGPGMVIGTQNGGCSCKCGSNCTCNPCTCEK